MPIGPCTVCEERQTAYMFTRMEDGETVNVCVECQPAFAAWLLEMTLGVDPDAVLALAGSGEVTPAEEQAASPAGEAPEAADVSPPPRKRGGRSRPTSSAGDEPPGLPESESDDATAADEPS